VRARLRLNQFDTYSITPYGFWLCPAVSRAPMTASRALPRSCELERLFVCVRLQPTVSTGVAVK
jgi:hypothetical protein